MEWAPKNRPAQKQYTTRRSAKKMARPFKSSAAVDRLAKKSKQLYADLDYFLQVETGSSLHPTPPPPPSLRTQSIITNDQRDEHIIRLLPDHLTLHFSHHITFIPPPHETIQARSSRVPKRGRLCQRRLDVIQNHVRLQRRRRLVGGVSETTARPLDTVGRLSTGRRSSSPAHHPNHAGTPVPSARPRSMRA